MNQNHTHFRQNIRHVPQVNQKTWLLVVDGYVSRSLTINYNTFTTRPTTTLQAALSCAGHSPDAPMLMAATWGGVPFADIVQDISPQARAQFANFSCADGYTTSLPTDALHDALLVHTMNGKPLPPEHGFPVRLMVPGQVGYKMPKWITHITLSDTPRLGTWERRGLPADGAAEPVIVIDDLATPVAYGEPVKLRGRAYGGAQAVSRVFARIDGGTRNNVVFTDGAAGQLAYWQATWQPPAPGRYLLEVGAECEGASGKQIATHQTIIEVHA